MSATTAAFTARRRPRTWALTWSVAGVGAVAALSFAERLSSVAAAGTELIAVATLVAAIALTWQRFQDRRQLHTLLALAGLCAATIVDIAAYGGRVAVGMGASVAFDESYAAGVLLLVLAFLPARLTPGGWLEVRLPLARSRRASGPSTRTVVATIAAGCLLGTLASVPAVTLAQRAALPPLGSAGALSIGCRLVAFALVMLSLRRLLAGHDASVATALRSERQRIAYDLHDGLCQDLAFIATAAGRLAADDDRAQALAQSARRALAESRGVLGELSAARGGGAHQSLKAVIAELQARFEIAVSVARPAVELPAATWDVLVHITREAITNAACHGHARCVAVQIAAAHGTLELQVVDDGDGFPADGRWREGFGIRSMRARAAALGGRLETRSRPDGHTEVTVTLPWARD